MIDQFAMLCPRHDGSPGSLRLVSTLAFLTLNNLVCGLDLCYVNHIHYRGRIVSPCRRQRSCDVIWSLVLVGLTASCGRVLGLLD